MHLEKLVLLLKDNQANDQRNRNYIASVWAKITQEMGTSTLSALVFFFAYFAVHIGCRTFQMALPDSSKMYFIGKE